MKNKFITINLIALVFSLFLFTSCEENKKEDKPVSKEELISSMEYQCPMDCEKGKTYHEEGSCPVCKMDLKAVDQGDAMTCKQHKDGKCTCEGDKCKCENCPEHS